MSMFLMVAATIASATIFIYFLLIIFWLFRKKQKLKPLSSFPPIAILVAARNEEKNLARCLDALIALNYPPEKVQIWIGNDGSSDNTEKIARKYAQTCERVKVINICEKLGQADAKGNVLAHLIAASAAARPLAQHLLITDADTRVNPDWAVGMLQQTGGGAGNYKMGVITGVTLIRGKTVGARLQCLDWLLGLGMVKVASDFGKPITTLGSNMLVSRDAYKATGGYENMPFSITEDYTLLHETFRLKYDFCNAMNPKVLAASMPITSLQELLQQRVRWMKGAMQLPWWIIICLFTMALFYPLLLLIAIKNLWLAFALFFLKLAVESIFATLVMNRLQLGAKKMKNLLFLLPLYELYAAALSVMMIIFYFSPAKVQWKGRNF